MDHREDITRYLSAFVRIGRVFVIGVASRLMEHEYFAACRVYEYFKPPMFLTQAAVNAVSFFCYHDYSCFHDVPADEGFLCDEAATFGVSIKETSSNYLHTYYMA